MKQIDGIGIRDIGAASRVSNSLKPVCRGSFALFIVMALGRRPITCNSASWQEKTRQARCKIARTATKASAGFDGLLWAKVTSWFQPIAVLQISPMRSFRILVIVGSPVQTNLVTGLSQFQFAELCSNRINR